MQCGRGTQKCLLLNGDRAFPMAQLTCNVGDTGDARSISESGRSPGEGKWPSTPVFVPGGCPGQRSLVGYSPQGHRASDTTERLGNTQWGWADGHISTPYSVAEP